MLSEIQGFVYLFLLKTNCWCWNPNFGLVWTTSCESRFVFGLRERCAMSTVCHLVWFWMLIVGFCFCEIQAVSLCWLDNCIWALYKVAWFSFMRAFSWWIVAWILLHEQWQMSRASGLSEHLIILSLSWQLYESAGSNQPGIFFILKQWQWKSTAIFFLKKMSSSRLTGHLSLSLYIYIYI